MILTHHSISAPALGRYLSTHPVSGWLYLGPSYQKLVQFQERVPDLERLSISRQLHEAAWRLRRDYVEWSASFTDRYRQDPAWWGSLLWERNTLTNPVFLTLCYLDALKQLLEGRGSHVLVVCETAALLHTVYDNFRKRGVAIQTVGYAWIPCMRETLYECGRLVARWGMGLGRLWADRRAAAKTGAPVSWEKDSGVPRVIVHSCLDDSSLEVDGKVRNRYFPGLAEWLTQQGMEVWTLAWIGSTQKKSVEWARRLRGANQRFILLEDHVALGDYIWAFRQLVRGVFRIPGRHRIAGWDLTRMVNRVRFEQAGHLEAVRFFLYDRMVRRWAKKSVRVNRFIDFFENYSMEKPILLALKRWFPKITTVGYLHTGGQPFNLRYTTTENELAQAPYPDRIVTYGPWIKQNLAADGFPGERLVSGPALRFEHLLESQTAPQVSSRDILVALPLSQDPALELLAHALECLQDSKLDATVWVKPHPMTQRDTLLKALKLIGLPTGWQWAEGGLDSWLDRVACVVASDGSAVVETLCRGVPVVVVGKEGDLQQNLLEWFKDDLGQHPRFSNEDITAAVEQALSLNSDNRATLREQGRKLTERIFSPVDDSTWSAFIG